MIRGIPINIRFYLYSTIEGGGEGERGSIPFSGYMRSNSLDETLEKFRKLEGYFKTGKYGPYDVQTVSMETTPDTDSWRFIANIKNHIDLDAIAPLNANDPTTFREFLDRNRSL
jgi:hypothetical protein